MVLFSVSNILSYLYALGGFTSIFFFLGCNNPGYQRVGGAGYQGRALGWLECGRRATAALLGIFTFILFSLLHSEPSGPDYSADRVHAFRYVVLASSMITLVAGTLIWFFVPKSKNRVIGLKLYHCRGPFRFWFIAQNNRNFIVKPGVYSGRNL